MAPTARFAPSGSGYRTGVGADPFSLVTLPLRAALGAARLGFSLAGAVVDALRRGQGGEHETAGPADAGGARSSVSAPARSATAPPAPPPPPGPVVADEPPEPAHVSEEPVLVAEVADQGAEEGVGASIRVDEPWEGYGRMRANEVLARIERATKEELAVVQLYETTHRRRKTVLAAAERRLKVLSPPR